jgi:hypothetical protein
LCLPYLEYFIRGKHLCGRAEKSEKNTVYETSLQNQAKYTHQYLPPSKIRKNHVGKIKKKVLVDFLHCETALDCGIFTSVHQLPTFGQSEGLLKK